MPALPLTLIYDAPAECPPEQTLRSAVENLVGSSSARPFSASVSLRRVGEGYEAGISSPDGSTRVLRGASCAEVVEGTSVVLALSITPRGVELAPTAPTATPTRKVPGVGREAARTPTRWVLAPTARGDVGTLPRPAIGFGAQLGIARGPWSFYGLGTYWLGARGSLASEPSLGGQFSWWTGGLRGCGAPMSGRLRVEVCLGGEVGELSGLGVGDALQTRKHPKTAWAALSAELGASWAISGSLRVRASLGVAAVLVGRRPFEIDQAAVHEPSALAGRAEVGPEVVF